MPTFDRYHVTAENRVEECPFHSERMSPTQGRCFHPKTMMMSCDDGFEDSPYGGCPLRNFGPMLVKLEEV